MIKCVALDFQGPSVLLEKQHWESHIRAAADFGLALTFEDCLAKLPHFIGGPDRAVADEIASLCGESGTTILESKRNYFANLIKTVPIKPRAGLVEAIRCFRRLKLKVAIGSLDEKAQSADLLERSGLAKLIGWKNIVLADYVKALKPDPEVYILTANRCGVDPSQQIVFEDSHNGIKAALAAKSKCAIGMPVSNKPIVIQKLLESGACRIFMDWREINIQALIENLNGVKASQ